MILGLQLNCLLVIIFLSSLVKCVNITQVTDPNLRDKLTNFNWEFYLKYNPDVATVTTTSDEAFEHYIKYGYYEKRWSNPSERPSLAACHRLKEMLSLETAYCEDLEHMQYKLKLFDWSFYLKYNPDLNAAGVENEEQATEHFIKFGYHEKRWSNPKEKPTLAACLHAKEIIVLNPKYATYCNFHLQVFKHTSKNDSSHDNRHLDNKLTHSLTLFNWEFYLKFNPDLAVSITTKQQALEHYINYGYYEKRWSSSEERPSVSACARAKEIIAFIPKYVELCQPRKFEDYACEKDQELEELVTTNSTRTIHYILSHEDHSKQLAHAYSRCRDWVYVMKLIDSVFLDSESYRFLLAHSNQWISYDFVIISSYKTIEMTASELKNLLLHAHEKSYDVVPFLRSHASFIDQMRFRHGLSIISAWDALLLKLGYDISRIREFDKAKPFFRNIFIIKPQILLEISKFIEKAMKVITSDSNLSLLFKVKRTSSSKDKRKKLFDASLNPMKYDYLHSFIFERLPSFFLYNMNNAKVCINEASGPCVANTEFFHYDGNNIVVDKA